MRHAGFMLLCALAAMLGGAAVRAEGAVAIGLPANVAKNGIALGDAVNYATRDAAAAKALKNCRAFQGAPVAVKLCKLEQIFHRQCLAYAMDPKPGTPGVGWAIASDQAAAEKQAMAKCAATAGPDRRTACEVSGKTPCDTSG
jgi:uncharacterized protein DUF4189